MDNIRLKSVTCGGLTIAPKRGEKFTLYLWSSLCYKGLIVATTKLKTHYRKPDGRWVTNRIRDLSLMSSTLADNYGYALVVVKSDEEAKRVATLYANGNQEAKDLIEYFQGVVD